jgi:hypothetical protein
VTTGQAKSKATSFTEDAGLSRETKAFMPPGMCFPLRRENLKHCASPTFLSKSPVGINAEKEESRSAPWPNQNPISGVTRAGF